MTDELDPRRADRVLMEGEGENGGKEFVNMGKTTDLKNKLAAGVKRGEEDCKGQCLKTRWMGTPESVGSVRPSTLQ